MVLASLSPAIEITPDEVQLGYSENVPWTSEKGGFQGTYRSAGPASSVGEKTATWTITVPEPNRPYTVQATWVSSRVNASDAPFHIFDGLSPIKTVKVNQKRAPRGEKVKNSIFQDLGTFLIQGKTMRVVLTNQADGIVVADTVRAKPAR